MLTLVFIIIFTIGDTLLSGALSFPEPAAENFSSSDLTFNTFVFLSSRLHRPTNT